MSLKDLINSDVDRVLINDRDFGETITLHASPLKCEVEALVSLDDNGLIEDEIPELEGTLAIKSSDEFEFKLGGDPVKTATIRGEVFHIFGPPIRESGMTTFKIRRHRAQEPYSNHTDLNDDQASFLG